MVVARQSVIRVLARSQPTAYVCRSCRHQLSRTGIPFQQQRFASDGEAPIAEKARRSLRGSNGGLRSLEKQQLRTKDDEETAEAEELQRQIDEQDRLAAEEQKQSITKAQTSITPAQSQPLVDPENIEGLEFVGSSGFWREMPQKPEDDFSGWLDSRTRIAANRNELVSCLHQALVECFTCTQEGLDPATAFHIDPSDFDYSNTLAIASARIGLTESGLIGRVNFADEAEGKEFTDLLSFLHDNSRGGQPETATDIETESSRITEAIEDKSIEVDSDSRHPGSTNDALHYKVEDESFLRGQLHIEDPTTFTLLKRFSQLSGHRIPDPILNTAFASNRPLSYLIDNMMGEVVHPKPKKIAEILMMNSGLTNQSNVMIFPRRETPVDKEMEVGRWKVIEKELLARGIAPLGRMRSKST